MRKNLRGFCLEKLYSIELILNDVLLSPAMKLRLYAKKNILKHLVDYRTYNHFLSKEELDKYIEDSADIICGFYEE